MGEVIAGATEALPKPRPWAQAAHRARYRAAIAAKAALAPRTRDPVFVLCTPRTGSYVLVDYLNCLPGVTLRGEVLNPDTSIGPRRQLRRTRQIARHLRRSIDSLPGPVKGAKIFLGLRERGFTLDHLRAVFPEVRLVVLYRRSLADQYISGRIALEAGRWTHRRSGGGWDGRFVIDPEHWRWWLERRRSEYEDALAIPWVRDRAVVVAYEDMVSAPESVFSDVICPFLEVPPAPLTTRNVKLPRRALHEIVENLADVAPLLHDPRACLELP
jgi:hypothetical protein